MEHLSKFHYFHERRLICFPKLKPQDIPSGKIIDPAKWQLAASKLYYILPTTTYQNYPTDFVTSRTKQHNLLQPSWSYDGGEFLSHSMWQGIHMSEIFIFELNWIKTYQLWRRCTALNKLHDKRIRIVESIQ